jgi:hypothetical protein
MNITKLGEKGRDWWGTVEYEGTEYKLRAFFVTSECFDLKMTVGGTEISHRYNAFSNFAEAVELFMKMIFVHQGSRAV